MIRDIGQIEPEWDGAVDDSTTPFAPKPATEHIAAAEPDFAPDMHEYIARALLAAKIAGCLFVGSVLFGFGLFVGWVLWGQS